MGHDLSPVRVHDDAVAAHSARSIGALAYALGDHVVFGEGQYSPSTSVGQRLLAHELVHTLQQVGQPAAPSARLAVSEPSDPLETEAEDIARKLERRAGASRHEVEAPLSGWKARPSIGRLTAARVMRAKGEFGAPKPGPVGPPCPGYEAGERETSFTTSGLLDDDVWSTGSGQLVIADFGVDWRHLKSNVATNLTLRKWLEKFESDDSYRLSIAGYSDCVGPEANNIDLRQGRARAVEGLLGPLARSRVGFRGMAGLQTYFADNATIEGRAKNRSVVIEFEQEFTLHEQVIEANPLECGPDVTAWLSSEMSTNANNPVIKTMREVRWPRYVPFFNIGWTSGALSDFKNLVRAGGPWDFKSHSQTLGWRAAPGHSCPTKPCDSTVTLCGMCYNYDVPGNLHYGWVGAAAGLRSWLLHFAAGLVQPGQWTDDPKDAVAVSIGIDMWDDGTDMCSALSDHHDELNLDKTAACDPCT